MTLDEINAEIAAARAEIKANRENLKSKGIHKDGTVDSIVISVPCSTFTAAQVKLIKEISETYDYSQCDAREITVDEEKVSFIFPYCEDYEVTKKYMMFTDCFCKGIRNSVSVNSAVLAMKCLQKAMDGEAEKSHLTTETDIDNLVKEIRSDVEKGSEPQ